MNNPLKLLGLLKGCPLLVIHALSLARFLGYGPVSGAWLVRATEYSDKPVAQALDLLKTAGLVERSTRRGWVLTRKGDELLALISPHPEDIEAAGITDAGITDAGIPDADISDAGISDAGYPGTAPTGAVGAKLPVSAARNSPTGKNSRAENLHLANQINDGAENLRHAFQKNSVTENFRGAIQQGAGVENVRFSAPKKSTENFHTSSSSSRSIESRKKENLPPLPTRPNGPQNSRTGDPPVAESPSGESRSTADSRYADVLAVLQRGGICEPARSRIAANPQVTPRIAQYHLATSQRTGQAIYRIENGWPVDPHWRSPDPVGAAAEADTREAEEDQSPLSAEEAAEAEAAEKAAEEAWEAAEVAFKAAVQSLAGSFPRGEFITWVQSLWLGPVEGEVFQVETGNRFGLAWLEQHHVWELLEKELQTITGQAVQVRLVVG